MPKYIVEVEQNFKERYEVEAPGAERAGHILAAWLTLNRPQVPTVKHFGEIINGEPRITDVRVKGEG